MKYGSVCSGIEAASVAWEPLGWEPAWFSEIDPFPSAVLAHRFPGVPNLGDMTTVHETKEFQDGKIDLLVGGTPCQSFSVAGYRRGLDDPRGSLALALVRLVDLARPRWVVWENVPGVLSSDGGRAFGSVLGALSELGYGWSYRVLDAQYFGVPQRRRRVFVVGHLGDWRRAAAVLFEPPGSGGNFEKKPRTQQTVACTITTGVGKRLNPYQDNLIPSVAHALTAHGGIKAPDTVTYVAQWPKEIACTLNAAFGSKLGLEDQHVYGGASLFVPHTSMTGVRRLTPRECERLQGFPDDWTLVPYRGRDAADGPRYKACGNSMAVPVMRWIGQRIAFIDALPTSEF